MAISGKTIWRVLRDDPAFETTLTMEQMNVLQPYVEQIPEVLDDLLVRTFNLSTLSEGRARFIDHCLKNGFVDKIAEVTPALKAMGGMLKGLFGRSLQNKSKEFHQLAVHTGEELKSKGVTEEYVLYGLGLSRENMARFKNGELTVGDVLMNQPAVFAKNI